jgi:hypothetical protein
MRKLRNGRVSGSERSITQSNVHGGLEGRRGKENLFPHPQIFLATHSLDNALIEMGKMKTFARAASMIVAIGLWIMFAGCSESNPAAGALSTGQAVRSEGPRQPITKTIQIISQPPGARIQVNDDYIGDAPCVIQVASDSSGRFWERTKIEAIPRAYGYTQMKLFIGYGQPDNPYAHSDKIPARIFFDTNLGPVSPEVNVNVNQ